MAIFSGSGEGKLVWFVVGFFFFLNSCPAFTVTLGNKKFVSTTKIRFSFLQN